MKRVLFFCLALLWAGALDGQDTLRLFLPDSIPPERLWINSTPAAYSLPSFDCEHRREETPWEVMENGNRECAGRCAGAFTSPEYCHEWVNAEDEDVNPSSPITTVVYYPCGSPWSVVWARICARCGREERKSVRHWFEQVPKEESEFKRLKRKFHGSDN